MILGFPRGASVAARGCSGPRPAPTPRAPPPRTARRELPLRRERAARPSRPPPSREDSRACGHLTRRRLSSRCLLLLLLPETTRFDTEESPPPGGSSRPHTSPRARGCRGATVDVLRARIRRVRPEVQLVPCMRVRPLPRSAPTRTPTRRTRSVFRPRPTPSHRPLERTSKRNHSGSARARRTRRADAESRAPARARRTPCETRTSRRVRARPGDGRRSSGTATRRRPAREPRSLCKPTLKTRCLADASPEC